MSKTRRRLDPAAEEAWFKRQFAGWREGNAINPYTGDAELAAKRKRNGRRK